MPRFLRWFNFWADFLKVVLEEMHQNKFSYEPDVLSMLLGKVAEKKKQEARKGGKSSRGGESERKKER